MPCHSYQRLKLHINNESRKGLPGISRSQQIGVRQRLPIVKKNGDVPICDDLKRFNDDVKRGSFMLPTLDYIAPKRKKAKYFSKLEASKLL